MFKTLMKILAVLGALFGAYALFSHYLENKSEYIEIYNDYEYDD